MTKKHKFYILLITFIYVHNETISWFHNFLDVTALLSNLRFQKFVNSVSVEREMYENI